MFSYSFCSWASALFLAYYAYERDCRELMAMDEWYTPQKITIKWAWLKQLFQDFGNLPNNLKSIYIWKLFN